MHEVHVEASSEAISTLDEPISQTLKRDLVAVGRKMVVVVCPPLANQRELREWDLWGPLFLCLVLAIILSTKAKEMQGSLIFSAVFVFVWFGSAIITLNAKFLGSQISFFQMVCVMGYCLAPLCVSAIIACFVHIFVVKALVAIGMWLWASWSALRFFRGTTVPEREMLVVYPVALFYFFFSWMIVVGV